MENCARRSTIYTILVFLWLFTALSPVYGRGGRDAALTKADELITEKEYEEAILVLTDFARRNPDRFDRAHERLRRIYLIREEFNNTADELIETLINEPENDEKILALSSHLYTLEKEDSPLLVRFVARTREIAQFNVNRNNLRNILERGRELLDNGESVAAMQTYSGGMGFMRDEFFSAGYSTEIENEVRRETERINSILASFQQAGSQMEAISTEYVRAINAGDPARIPEITNRLTPAMDRFIALKQELYIAADTIERNLESIRAIDPETGDRNHLAFLSVLIHGRIEEDVQEGMLGAFDNYWQNTIGACVNAIIAVMERANSVSLARFESSDYSAAVTSLDRMENFFNLSLPFFEKHLQLFQGESPHTITLFGNTILYNDIPPFLELQSLNEANNSLRQAANVAIRQNIDRSSFEQWQAGSINTTAALTNEQQTRNNLTILDREIEAILNRSNQINTEINSHYNVQHMTATISAIENLQRRLIDEEQQSVQRYFIIANNDLQNSMNTRRQEMERGRNFLNGESRASEDGVVTVLLYPAEALEVFTPMVAAMTASLETSNAILARHRNEPSVITDNEEISNLHSVYQTSVNELTALRNQGLELAETARSRSSQAEAYRLDGDRLFREAQAASQRQDFDTARDRVQRASDRMNLSLEIQESEELRAAWDNQLLSLSHDITRSENELIITEVRNLLNGAQAAYFAGNFQQAEDNLVRARNRWRVTNPTENEEVIYWLGIIRTALSARSGRVIPPTAPLFAEMSQLLSQAQRSYEEGVRYINTGQRTQGLAKFDEAQLMTREVRLMFPLNQEAGILELRIEQFLDPAAFNAAFEQRLRTAIAGTRQRSIEAFADLQNLAEINPRYPNIRAILTQAEIDMGFRPPPPNPANIARSRELTASVNRILDGNVTTLYEAALTQIDEAIALNPNNMEATLSKDRLLSRMSVPSAIVLTSEDEEIFQRAMREFQAGNNLVAYALVESLMQNPGNRNITKLVDLQRRIQSVL